MSYDVSENSRLLEEQIKAMFSESAFNEKAEYLNSLNKDAKFTISGTDLVGILKKND